MFVNHLRLGFGYMLIDVFGAPCVLWSEAPGNFEFLKKGVVEPSGTHVTRFQSDMECDVSIDKHLLCYQAARTTKVPKIKVPLSAT